MHEDIDQTAVDKPEENCAINKECQPAASEIVSGRGAERDEEVQDDSKGGSLGAAVERFTSEDAAGNRLRDENGLSGAVNQDRINQIQHTDDDASARPSFVITSLYCTAAVIGPLTQSPA